MSLVEIRPIETPKWHNKTGKESFSSPITIEALISGKTNQFATGLNEEDRVRLEKKTGLNLSPDYIEGGKDIFWLSSQAQVKLPNQTKVFDTKKPLDEIKVNILKASDLVANSQREFDEGLYPEALFVIFDEKEELEINATKISLKNNLIIESSKLSQSKKCEIIQIVTGISVKGQSENYIISKYDSICEKESAERIMTLIKRDAARTTLHAMVLEALYKSTLRKEGTAIYYMDDQIGFDVESAIDYLQDKRNQQLKAQIIERIS